MLAFCYLRPSRGEIYEPRAKQCHGRPLPPLVPKAPFAWLRTLAQTKESDLATLVGPDAAVFLYFTKMMRSIFTALTIVAAALLIPINISTSTTIPIHDVSVFSRLTPQYSKPGRAFWAYVAFAYLFDLIVCYYLWSNYKKVLQLRREFFRSVKYQESLHARTLLVTGLPSPLSLDHEVGAILGVGCGASIGRNVVELGRCRKDHTELVQTFEKKLANSVGWDSTTDREKIEIARRKIELLMRSPGELKPLSYGFVVFKTIQEAHTRAYRYREGGPQGTTIQLATDQHNFIWDNLHRSEDQRRRRRWRNSLATTVLTVAWIVPNAFIAVFLCNLSSLGLVWPAFQRNLHAHHTAWGVFQGIVPAAVTFLFYLCLPTIFRRIAGNSGDIMKTSRERHVAHKLLSFFLFNNLVVFSLFSTFWRFGAALLNASSDVLLEDDLFQNIVLTLIDVTPYWCSWLLQRNLGRLCFSVTCVQELLTSARHRRRSYPGWQNILVATEGVAHA